MASMTCSFISQECLIEYIDGTLQPGYSREVQQHLAECHECQQTIEEIRALLSELTTFPAWIEPDHDLWPAILPRLVKPDWLVTKLRESIAARDIEYATQLAEQYRDRIADLQPSQAHAAALLDAFMQWVDIGFAHRGSDLSFSHLDLVKAALARFPSAPRPMLPLIDCAHLEMVEGFLAMHVEDYNGAIEHFTFVSSLGQQLDDKELITIALYSTANANSHKGLYTESAARVNRAIVFAQEAKRKEMIATCEVLKGWVLLQQNNICEAETVLHRAKQVLITSSDHRSLGNIESSLGRVAQRRGEYERAINHFERSVEQYRKHDKQHKNIARAFVNMAFVSRLLALRIESVSGQKRAEPNKFRTLASGWLDEAENLYGSHRDYHRRGRGSVLLVRSLLDFDDDSFEEATSKAKRAFEIGSEIDDCILCTRAALHLCMIDNFLAERDLERGESPGLRLERARSYAMRGLKFSRCTQRTRLLVRALVWLGVTLINPYFHDHDGAVECYVDAQNRIEPDDRDHVWEDLQSLKNKITRAGIPIPRNRVASKSTLQRVRA